MWSLKHFRSVDRKYALCAIHPSHFAGIILPSQVTLQVKYVTSISVLDANMMNPARVQKAIENSVVHHEPFQNSCYVRLKRNEGGQLVFLNAGKWIRIDTSA
jgi:hypothetical protein